MYLTTSLPSGNCSTWCSIAYPNMGQTLAHPNQYSGPSTKMELPTVGSTYQGMAGVTVVFWKKGAMMTNRRETTQKATRGGQARKPLRSATQFWVFEKVR